MAKAKGCRQCIPDRLNGYFRPACPPKQLKHARINQDKSTGRGQRRRTDRSQRHAGAARARARAALTQVATVPERYDHRDLHTGRLRYLAPLGAVAAQRYGALMYNVHRADLVALRYNALPRDAEQSEITDVPFFEKRTKALSRQIPKSQEVSFRGVFAYIYFLYQLLQTGENALPGAVPIGCFRTAGVTSLKGKNA